MIDLRHVCCALLVIAGLLGGCSDANRSSAMEKETQSVSGKRVTCDPSASREKVFVGFTYWDLDGGGDADRPTADLWWRHLNSRERYLMPRNGAAVAVVRGRDFDQLTREDLQDLKYTAEPVSASDVGAEIDTGAVVAVRTNEGRYAKLLIVGFESKAEDRMAKEDLRLRYVIFR